ncbi:hypothetical protein EUTSA_v10028428mg [Eutrema salsugineum]|uniref:ADP-ribosyl cyclase/cyclic ADP-ribose hydrolase n=1 Tax=Eutrema salsugineum TaxID=72664 RepID=V4L4M8_EUTSA|nr:hypothetical protein EUTSA_v10028428mg [Eutrema salsugineum]
MRTRADVEGQGQIFPKLHCFRGEDVRRTFLSHLVGALDCRLVRTVFKDSQIERGHSISPALVQAIRESKISIVVLSKNYASSSWCLNELLEILKCREELDQIVMTIFYDLDPSHVRNQTGDFGKAFEITCEDKTEDEAKQWRLALTQVANIHGHLLVNVHMIEDFVNDVSCKLNCSPSEDSDGLIGIEVHVANMVSLLCLDAKEVMMVGIWALQGLLQLQNRFLSEILDQKDVKIDRLGVLGGRLKNQKVLIVIDDDVHLLRSHGIDRVYEVGFPSEDQAFQMFCQSAFSQGSPFDGFMELAVKISELAGNLPLGLKLLGSSLRGRKKEDWVDMLPELRTCLNGEIEKALRFSYDALKETHKKIFLHIACLFNGAKVDNLKWLLADSDFDVDIGLKSLVDKSLICITHLWKTVEMHSLLQEMGRGIVSAQSFDEPGKRQFLVDSKKICDVLEDNTGTKAVLGISWDRSEIDELFTLDEGAFEGMCNLRFLKIYKNPLKSNEENKLYLPKGIKSLSRRLRLLHWDAYPMKCMPSNFSPANLVELDMIDSELEKMWEGTQPLKHLKSMSLWSSKKLKEIPDLSKATNLEELYLADCLSLEMLPTSIQNLKKLKTLNMEECRNLEVLPKDINLESLSNLTLYGCSRVVSFPDISRNISVLSLENTVIEEVPWWIENISGLTLLLMSGCSKLRRISPNISKLKHLEEIDFSISHTNSVFKYMILPGGEVPEYFTHRATGSYLMIPLLQSSLYGSSLRFKACVLGNNFYSSDLHILIFITRLLDSHVVIFDCCFPLKKDSDPLAASNYDAVELKFGWDICDIKHCAEECMKLVLEHH